MTQSIVQYLWKEGNSVALFDNVHFKIEKKRYYNQWPNIFLGIIISLQIM